MCHQLQLNLCVLSPLQLALPQSPPAQQSVTRDSSRPRLWVRETVLELRALPLQVGEDPQHLGHSPGPRLGLLGIRVGLGLRFIHSYPGVLSAEDMACASGDAEIHRTHFPPGEAKRGAVETQYTLVLHSPVPEHCSGPGTGIGGCPVPGKVPTGTQSTESRAFAA